MERLEVTETFAGIALPGHLHTTESLQFATNFLFRDTDVVIVTYPKSGKWHWVGRGQGWDGMEWRSLALSHRCQWAPALPAWPGAGPALRNHHPLPAQPHSRRSWPHHHAGWDGHPTPSSAAALSQPHPHPQPGAMGGGSKGQCCCTALPVQLCPVPRSTMLCCCTQCAAALICAVLHCNVCQVTLLC